MNLKKNLIYFSVNLKIAFNRNQPNFLRPDLFLSGAGEEPYASQESSINHYLAILYY